MLRILIALYAQFGPGKFPDTFSTVVGCVIAYSLVTFVLYYYVTRYEGDSFLITRPKVSEGCPAAAAR